MVKSSYGHIRDLPRKNMSIDIDSGTFEPTYEISDDKKKQLPISVKKLKIKLFGLHQMKIEKEKLLLGI